MGNNIEKLYQEFIGAVELTVQQLKEQGRPTQTYTDDQGNSIEGWEYARDPGYRSEDFYGNSGFRESWGGGSHILSTEGEFYYYSWDYQDQSYEPREVRHHTLIKSSARKMIGRKGKPFKDMTQALQRLAWQ